MGTSRQVARICIAAVICLTMILAAVVARSSRSTGPRIDYSGVPDASGTVWRGEPSASVHALDESLGEEAAALASGRTSECSFQSTGMIRGLTEVVDHIDQVLVACEAVRDGNPRLVETLRPRSDGSWGPIAIPLMDVDGYRFVLSGGGLAVASKFFECPQLGALLHVSFDATFGNDISFRIVDEQRVVLPEAEAIVRWMEEGVPIEVRATLGQDGITVVRGCPRGTISWAARCPGYSTVGVEADVVTADASGTRTVVLRRSLPLRGECVFHGAPVKEFVVTLWPAGEAAGYSEYAFDNRSDGSFEVPQAPTGAVSIFAVGGDWGASDVVRTAVSGSETTFVRLVFKAFTGGRGTVVTQATGEAVANAAIEVYRSDSSDMVRQSQVVVRAESDGSFVIRTLADGLNVCEVNAPGYGTARVEIQGVPGEVADLGVIRLARKQDLALRFVRRSAADQVPLFVTLNGPDLIPSLEVPDSNVVRLQAVSCGRYIVYVFRDGAPFLTTSLVLTPGEIWQHDLIVGGDADLQVQVLSSTNEPLPEAMQLIVTSVGSGDASTEMYYPVPPSGLVSTVGVSPGRLAVLLLDASNQALAMITTVIEAGGGDAPLILWLDQQAQPFRLAVFDSQGRPVPEVRVHMTPARVNGAWVEERTDGRGECGFRGLEPGDYLASIFHASLGSRSGIPVAIERDQEHTQVLTFEPDGVLHAILRDGIRLQPEVACRLYDISRTTTLAALSSDAHGEVRWNHIGTGKFVIKIVDPAYWPIETIVSVVPEDVPVEVQVRRRGDLELELVRTSGSSVADQRLTIVSVESGQDLPSMFESVHRSLDSGALTSDMTGRVRLDGLPEGEFRWHALVDGTEKTGLVRVAPGAVTRATVVIE